MTRRSKKSGAAKLESRSLAARKSVREYNRHIKAAQSAFKRAQKLEEKLQESEEKLQDKLSKQQ